MRQVNILSGIDLGGVLSFSKVEDTLPEVTKPSFAIVNGVPYTTIFEDNAYTWHKIANIPQSFMFTAETAGTLWHINHGMGTKSLVINVFDEEGELVHGMIKIVDENTVDVSFMEPTRGYAVLVFDNVETTNVSFDRYDLALVTADQVLDLNLSQVFTIDNDVERTLTFVNEPSPSRAMTLVIILRGNTGTIVWPDNVEWSEDSPPEPNENITVIALIWTGSGWLGTMGPNR